MTSQFVATSEETGSAASDLTQVAGRLQELVNDLEAAEDGLNETVLTRL